MLVRREAQRDVLLVNSKDSNLPESRNRIVDAALAHGSDWLFFLDSDMVFPADALDRLLSHGQSIVGATYCRRVHPFSLIGEPLEGAGDGDLLPMKRMPTGCLLIATAVFRSLPRPWFFYEPTPDRSSSLSEDYVFCDHARAAGWTIWCDRPLSGSIGHISQQIVTTRNAGQFANVTAR